MWSKCNMSEPDPTFICVSLWGHELFEENKWLAVDIYQEPGSPRQWFDIGSSLHPTPIHGIAVSFWPFSIFHINEQICDLCISIFISDDFISIWRIEC